LNYEKYLFGLVYWFIFEGKYGFSFNNEAKITELKQKLSDLTSKQGDTPNIAERVAERVTKSIEAVKAVAGY